MVASLACPSCLASYYRTVEGGVSHSNSDLSYGHTKMLFGNRHMTASHIITAKLLAAVSTSDLKAAATCLTSYIHGTATFDTVFEREAAVDAIVAAMKGFGDAGMIAACLGALSQNRPK
eukprot:4994776-Prymnesium_polylepis.2